MLYACLRCAFFYARIKNIVKRAAMTNRIFITSIGPNQKYDAISYGYANRTAQSKLAPVGIKNVIPALADAATYVFATEKALAMYGASLQKEIGAHLVPVIEPTCDHSVHQIFRTIESTIPKNAELYLDITCAFRSLQMIYFAIAVYFTGLKDATIKGIYYGAREQSKDDVAPVVDLLPIVDAVRWFYASRLFRDYGISALMGERLEVIQNTHWQLCEKPGSCPKKLTSLGRILRNISLGLSNADAVAIGENCANVRGMGSDANELQRFVPLAELLVNEIVDTYAVFGESPMGELNENELARESALIDWYLEHGQYKNALTLMREWLVNKVILCSGAQARWLDYGGVRKPAECAITRLTMLLKEEKYKPYLNKLTPELQKLAKTADFIFETRNKLSHGGFCAPDERINYKTLPDDVGTYWRAAKNIDDATIKAALSRNATIGALIVSPFGLSPGVLYTLAARLSEQGFVQPTAKLLLVTSGESEKRIDECLSEAGISTPYETHCLGNPHADIIAQDQMECRWLDTILSAEKVIVNYTGGTSIMQVNVQRIAAIARKFGVSVCEAVVIDKRSIDEQRNQPYVKGDILFID